MMSIFVALAVVFEIWRGCSSIIISPVEGYVHKSITIIGDSCAKAAVRPVKRKLKTFEMGQLEIKAYLKASLTEEQKNTGESYYKHDSIVAASSKEEE